MRGNHILISYENFIQREGCVFATLFLLCVKNNLNGIRKINISCVAIKIELTSKNSFERN